MFADRPTRYDAGRLTERRQHSPARVRAITAQPESPVDELGKLTALAGVRQFPIRVKCASLAWHTLRAALDSRDEVVSTE